jgi:hypothetical protein
VRQKMSELRLGARRAATAHATPERPFAGDHSAARHSGCAWGIASRGSLHELSGSLHALSG